MIVNAKIGYVHQLTNSVVDIRTTLTQPTHTGRQVLWSGTSIPAAVPAEGPV